MKKILIILLAFTHLSVIAQDSTIQLSEVERVVDKYVDKTSEALKGLAEALEVPAEHVYNVLITQQKIVSFTWFSIFITGILGLFTIIRLVVFMEKKDYHEAAIAFTSMFGGGFSLAAIIIGVFHFEVMLTGFLNPEYGAIKDIANFIQ